MASHLSLVAVRQIARLIAGGLSDAYIADLYNIAPSTVSGIRLGKAHSDITGIEYRPKPAKAPPRRLSETEKAKALRLAMEGLTVAEIHRVIQRESPEVDYFPVAYAIRTARNLGVLPPPATRRGRLPGRQPKKLRLNGDQHPHASRLKTVGSFRGGRMKTAEIRSIVNAVIREFTEREHLRSLRETIDRRNTVDRPSDP
ncbi:hypothetical protein [Tautonia rosea]|uniref:hypothetical protein n=1 Tax=Tautonia rosea TaxID=2728037 RepID=UPI001476025A|nr:hypothetical protein [Tautonia rosea]